MLHRYTQGVEKHKHYNKPIKPLLFDRASNKKPESQERALINIKTDSINIINITTFQHLTRNKVENSVTITLHVFHTSKIACMLPGF